MTNVFVGLGSNKGKRLENISEAIKLLGKSGQKILKISPVYEAEPYGYKKQKKFLNAVIKLKTTLPPERFLKLCKGIEREIGRTKSFRWGPREIDLDILFYGKKILKKKGLKIPHKDLHNREFVLKPLTDIAPDFVHPVLGKRIKELCSRLTG